MRNLAAVLALAVLAGPIAGATATRSPPATGEVCEDCIRTHMERLAGPAARGRQCGSADEAAAARYLADELRAAGAKGAYDGRYLQPVRLTTARLAAPPTIEFSGPDGKQRWTHGQQILLFAQPSTVAGPLVRLADADPASLKRVRGAVVFLDRAKASPAARQALIAAGALAVLQPAAKTILDHWDELGDLWRETEVADAPGVLHEDTGPRVMLRPEPAETLRRLPEGSRIVLAAKLGEPLVRSTANVVGVIHGAAPDADRKAMLLSAHYDHLGVKGGVLYPGADDDASGVSAVLEFARLLGRGARPRRTVYFGLFGCEEEGALGARYFRAHVPTRLSDLSVNLEFEMIGLRDPQHPGQLMLTGWERSNLGPTLKAHGALIGPDFYPDENFFQRSDNYELALKGIVAQTVSGWPVPPSYHQPGDDLEHVDIGFMAQAVGSMAGPIRWLADSDFSPSWNPGGKP